MQQPHSVEDMNRPLVSVIVLAFNGIEYLGDCLSSITAQIYATLELIVVDNASQDGSAHFVQQRFPGVKLVQNSSNLGFAGGNNVGIRLAQGEYVALLNQDAKAEPHWIEELVKVAAQDERIGMCAPKLLYMNDPSRFNSAGHLMCIDLSTVERGIGEVDRGQYDQLEEAFAAWGAATFYRRAMLDQIGLFDEDYFILGEATDLAWRGRLAGWKCFYVPTAVVYHVHSASMGLYSPLKLYYGERNRIWNVVKLLPVSLMIPSALFSLRRYLAMALFALRSRGRKAQVARSYSLPSLGLTLLRAWMDALRGLPGAVRKRRQIQRTKKVSNRQIGSWLKQYKAELRDVVER